MPCSFLSFSWISTSCALILVFGIFIIFKSFIKSFGFKTSYVSSINLDFSISFVSSNDDLFFSPSTLFCTPFIPSEILNRGNVDKRVLATSVLPKEFMKLPKILWSILYSLTTVQNATFFTFASHGNWEDIEEITILPMTFVRKAICPWAVRVNNPWRGLGKKTIPA